MEALLFYNSPGDPGRIDAILFVVVLVSVLAVSRSTRDDEGSKSMSFSPRPKPVPAALQRFWLVRRLPLVSVAAGIIAGLLVPVVFTRVSAQFTFSRVLLYTVVALSLTLLTGWAGQLSLGQFAFVGLGALLTGSLMQGMSFEVFGAGVELPSIPFELAVVLAVVVAALVAMVVGTPALRVRGLFLAVTTLAFAVMATDLAVRAPVPARRGVDHAPRTTGLAERSAHATTTSASSRSSSSRSCSDGFAAAASGARSSRYATTRWERRPSRSRRRGRS